MKPIKSDDVLRKYYELI